MRQSAPGYWLIPALAALLFLPSATAQPTNLTVASYAIFSKNLLEFTWCGPFTVNGRVHANGSIYTGSGSSSPLTFNGLVTTTGTISSPPWGGHAASEYRGPITFNAGKITNAPPVVLSIDLTNAHSLIDLPPAGEDPNSELGQQRLFNQAQVVLLVSNASVTAIIQSGLLPGADADKRVIVSTNLPDAVQASFPFLVLTNSFTDQRENKTVLPTQIDLGLYRLWLATNSQVVGKFPADSGNYPAIVFIADNRANTSSQLSAVRITNATAPPANGGLGFTLATPNPLYVWGNCNQTNPACLNTTNTSSGTVPCGLLCDALTILSPNWVDAQSALSVGDPGKNPAANTTVNAAIVAGMVYSTGPNRGQYSGGIQNLPRLLENWGNGGSTTLTLNTSLISLFASTKATAQFRDPGNYYYAPTRRFSFDFNFLDPNRQPRGFSRLIPVAQPIITRQPQSRTVYLGDTVIFLVEAIGLNPLMYDWQFEGASILSGTNTFLGLTNVQYSQAGHYAVVVHDGPAWIESTNALLTVLPREPSIALQPSSQTVPAGGTALFTIAATGFPPLRYQWSHNGTNLDGATNASLTLGTVGLSLAGNYAAQVTNAFGSVLSSNATLYVYASAAALLGTPEVSADNQVQFQVTGVPEFDYAVQASSNLVDWVSLVTNASPFNFVDTNAVGFPQRFYRAVYSP